MSFFYDLNKRLAALATKQEQQQIAESKKAEAVAQSPLTQALNEGKRLPDIRLTDKNAGISQKDVDKHYSGSTIRMAQDLHDRGFSSARIAQTMHDLKHGTKAKDIEETDYSAKKAVAGKDIGKPGKNFSKIAKSAGAKYGSKAAGERVAGAVLNKLRHPKESAEMDESALQAYLGNKKYGKEGMDALRKAGREHAGKEKMNQIRNRYDKMDEADMEEGNEFTGNLAKAKAQHKDEFEVDGKKYKVVEADPTGLGEGTCPSCHCNPCECVEEGNAFTGKLAATPKGSKFKLGNKEFKDTSSIEEAEMDEGYAEMDAWLKSREKEKGTGKFDRKERTLPSGMKATTYTRKPEPEDDDDAEVTTITIKKKGRPAGTKRKIGAKHSGRSKLASKDAIAEEIPVTDRGEYDQEGQSAKHDIKTIVRHAQALHKILGDNDNLPEWVQSKLAKIEGMMIAVDEYMQNQDQEVSEKAPPGAKAERMVKHIKKSLSKDGKLSDKDKAIAYATTWKAKKAGKVEEEGSKPDFLDVDKDGNKKETFKKAAADKKEKKVDETTTSGSVATASAAPKASKGMQFGKGVYEGINSKVENMIAESMNITVNMSTDEHGQAQKSITVTATDEDADKLAELLKMAGIEQKQETCSVCGEADCGCGDEMVDENSPDWPTNTEKLSAQPELRTYSGGLNGPKSTGQTTVPVVASQLRRTSTMEENVELERSLFKTWKNYKG